MSFIDFAKLNIINPDRLIVSGKFIELYKYQHPPVPDESKYKRKKKKKLRTIYLSGDTVDEYIKKRSENNLHRARSTVRRIIDSNSDKLIKFNTLTYKDLVVDLDISHRHFFNFIRRLKDFIDHNSQYGQMAVQNKITEDVTFFDYYEVAGCHSSKDLIYVCVVEFMPSGRVHYHFLSNTKFISNYTPKKGKSVFAELWDQGYVKTNQIYSVSSLGAYVSKYLYKDFADDRLIGRKAYFTSRGLIRPQIFGTGMHSVFPEVFDALDVKNAKLLYESQWTDQYQDNVRYQKFYCDDLKNKK